MKKSVNTQAPPELVLSDGQLHRFGKNSSREARVHRFRFASAFRVRLLLRRGLQKLSQSAAILESRRASEFSHAAAWICDNADRAQAVGAAVLAELAGKHRLPALAEKPSLPAAFLLARSFALTGGPLSSPGLCAFLSGAGEYRKLSEGELFLFLPLLKASLLCQIADLAVSLTKESLAPEKAPFKRAEKTVQTLFTMLFAAEKGKFTAALLENSTLEQILRQDPAALYAQMDAPSRQALRRQIERQARRKRKPADRLAQNYLALAQKAADKQAGLAESHIGFYAEQASLRQKKPRQALFFLLEFLLPVGVSLFLALWLKSFWLFFVTLLPLWEVFRPLLQFFFLRATPPAAIPALDLAAGVPEEGRVLSVITTLFTDAKQPAKMAALLEEYHLANQNAGENAFYGLLADFPDAKTPWKDGEKAILQGAKAEIDRLNQQYGGRFCLLWRERALHQPDKIYMGKERKRGALTALAALVAGEKSDCLLHGLPEPLLQSVAFCITLDSDTRMLPMAVTRLVGAMLHPQNRPVVVNGAVARGYGILQPHMATELASVNATEFARIFAGQGGLSSYDAFVGDFYQDVFGRGIFMGKGIIDIRLMHSLLREQMPENKILSHDLLEGGFLRAGFFSRVEFSDGFCAKAGSYFLRMGRWIRGDAQLLPWLFPRIPTAKGHAKNPLPFLVKYQMADNLRRAVTPVVLFLCVVAFCLFSKPYFQTPVGYAVTAAFLSALAALFWPVFQSLLSLLFVRGRRVGTCFRATIYAGTAGALIGAVSRFLLLPHEAWVCARSLGKALFRMAVSKRKLLEWVTAAEAEKMAAPGKLGAFAALSACPLAAALLAGFGLNPASFTVAILWFFAPLYAWFLSLPLPKNTPVSHADRSFLQACAEEIHGYFRTYMNREENFLPPDNVQLAPCRETARRTSPTNIGFGLLSCIAADELLLASKESQLAMLENQLSVLERMEKHRGHFYNWYATENLAILPPASLSSVDSGNLAAALIVLAAWLAENNEHALANRAAALWKAMDFSYFYDKEQGLLRISRDVTAGKWSEGVYDLLASEARLTSYIAIAKGDIPPKHWATLGRALSKKKGVAGLLSWGGSMFEYLMPQIFLPEVQNSLLHQSNRYAVFCQRLRAEGLPWGCSESGYFAFDSGLHYRYKGHGVAALGLAPHLDDELVVAPYAAYLALLVEPQKAIANLQNMFSQGFAGEMGLFEAIDYTQSRLAGAKRAVVQSYMAHHMGMSLCAIANVLTADGENKGIFCRLFMQNPAMAAYASLQGERIPPRAPVVLPEKRRKAPKPLEDAPLQVSFANPSPFAPELHLLSADAGHIRAFSDGKTSFFYGDRAVYRQMLPEEGGLSGITAVVSAGNTLFSLGGPLGETASLSGEFGENRAFWRRESGGISLEKTLSLFPGDQGNVCTEKSVYVVQNNGKTDAEITFAVYFEPVLLPLADFESHPAFARLMLSSSPMENGVLIAKKDREGGSPIFAAFQTDTDAKFTASRADMFGRFAQTDLAALLENPESSAFGALPDGAVRMLCRFTLAPGEEKRIQTALSAGTTEETVCAEASAALSGARREAPRLKLTACALSLDGGGIAQALALGAKLLSGFERRFFAPPLAGRRDTLWRLGISGDMPMALLDGKTIPFDTAIYKAVRFHRLLRENGMPYDLILLTNDGGDYGRPQHTEALRAIALVGSETYMGEKGGIHLIDQTALTPEEKSTLRFASAVLLESDAPVPSFQRPIPYASRKSAEAVPGHAKSQPLANRYFGVLSADFGLSHLWCGNARLFRLTPWENDPLLAKSFGEELCLFHNGRRISLFCADDGYFARCDFGPGSTVWYKEIEGMAFRTTAFVHPKNALRTVIVEAEGLPNDSTVAVDWMLRPVLGEQNTENRRVISHFCEESQTLWGSNPFSPEGFPKILACRADTPMAGFTGDFAAYAAGDFDQKVGAGLLPCLAARFSLSSQSGRAKLTLWTMAGETPQSLPMSESDPASALAAAKHHRLALCGHVKIQTPSAALNDYMNHWAVWQIKGSRLYSRSSLYQNGGAFGFRDQLQDASSFLLTEPEILRAQLLRAACHQYREGDVQHWWHGGKQGGLATHQGVRTWCSDDLLWLCLCAYWYVSATNDVAILDVPLPYLVSRPLEQGEGERYESPAVSAEREPLLDHCIRAAELFIRRGEGEHGLPFLLGGDWNDGMNRLGGESSFLARFGSMALTGLADLCRRKDKTELAKHFDRHAAALSQAANEAFEGAWFLRGYDKHGNPVGARQNQECQIDSLVQSFAVFDEKSDPRKVTLGLDSALSLLVDRKNRIAKLFSPPFTGKSDPGYIAAYPPGVRENGGQYTHAAVWLAMAALMAGKKEEGTALLLMLLPAHHNPAIYKAEDFMLSADVSGEPPLTGRAGWSWYTGAAGWFRRAVLEALLGLTLSEGFLHVRPNVPESWPSFSTVLKKGDAEYRIFARKNLDAPRQAVVPFDDDGKIHEIWVRL